MKRKPNRSLLKSAGTCAGAMAVSAMMLSGCIGGTVYGPPPENSTPTPAPWLDFDPWSNQNEDVYGPPDDWDDYDPEEELPAPVYGPPEMMGVLLPDPTPNGGEQP